MEVELATKYVDLARRLADQSFADLQASRETAAHQAQTFNQQMDGIYKQVLTRWEPWKVVASITTAVAALAGVVGGILGYVLARR